MRRETYKDRDRQTDRLKERDIKRGTGSEREREKAKIK